MKKLISKYLTLLLLLSPLVQPQLKALNYVVTGTTGYANLFSAATINSASTATGTVTMSGRITAGLGEAGDRLYALVGGTTWTFVGVINSVGTGNPTVFTLSGNSAINIGTATDYMVLPTAASTTPTLTVNSLVTLTLDVNVSDSFVCNFILGKNSGGNVATVGTIIIDASNLRVVPISVSRGVSSTGTNAFQLTSGLLFWRSNVARPATIAFTYNGGTVIYYPYAAPVAGSLGIGSSSFSSISIIPGGSSTTYTAPTSLSISGTLLISSGATLSLTTNILTMSSGSTLTNNGTISTKATSGWITDSRTSGSGTYGGTVEFAASTGGQTIPNKTYENLTLSNSQGTNTLTGSTVVTGVLSITNSAGNLGLGNHWLTVARFSGPGHITGSANARINYTGANSSFLYMDSTSAITRKLRRLTLSSLAQLNLGNILSIDGHDNNKDTGEVVLNTDAILTSNIIGTASARLRLNYIDTTNRAHPFINIGHSSGSNIGKVVGEIYTEDFLQGGFDKRYRQWGHPLDSANGMSLNQFSDDVDCFGIVSSGNSGRGNLGNINGLYQNQTTPNVINNSIFKYDESNYGTSSRWVPFTNSGSTLYLERGMGYMFVLRPSGSSTGGGTSAIAPQFLEIEGQMNFADVTVSGLKISSTLKSTSTAGYNLLANPYPSHLDLTAFFNDNSDLNTTFYKYNKSSKNYETFTKGAGASWSKGPNTVSAIIDPMDAFWVQLNNAKTNPSLVANFKITQTTCSSLGGVGRSNKLEIDSTHYLNIGVKLKSQDDASVNDEATLYLGYNESDLSYKFRSGDANKLSGTCNELNIQSASGEKLATKSLDLRRDWTVPLNLKVCKLGVYDFVFDVVTNVDLSKYDIEFFDKSTGKSTPIVVGQNVKVDINNVANEFIEGRFFISFKNSQAKINAVGNSKRVILYPNPVSKNDVVHIVTLDNEKGNLQLMDSRGKVIMSKYYNGSPETVNIDLKKYSICEGIYFISFKSELNNQTVKLSIF